MIDERCISGRNVTHMCVSEQGEVQRSSAADLSQAELLAMLLRSGRTVQHFGDVSEGVLLVFDPRGELSWTAGMNVVLHHVAEVVRVYPFYQCALIGVSADSIHPELMFVLREIRARALGKRDDRQQINAEFLADLDERDVWQQSAPSFEVGEGGIAYLKLVGECLSCGRLGPHRVFVEQLGDVHGR